MKPFTLKDILNSPCGHLNTNITEAKKIKSQSRVVAMHFKRKSKEKDYIAWNLLQFCNENLLKLEEEYKFHPDRKWRFDWVIASHKIAIEYNGIMSEKSRHTTIKGYSGDMQKINAAQKLGFTVLQYTPLTYLNLITDLKEAIHAK